ncbi:hypothetical protein [Phenylobacterium sp. 58.2.17]|uniref:hypothetical protein n=1 Tax=Phenylobacterium sp. 58.2.17 TaxID=2969306 RepID=UPI002264446A|nr:hypothetical protein [Phenylobacterium sp. 58.2.17]MCX7588036.1 hypothetical protein [Phenylobacterium sp. 58.2.17]
MALTVFAEGPVSLDPQKALYIPVGAASPLWFLFAGAASAGLAYWWMTRFTDRTNLEALLGASPAGGAVLPAPDVVPPELAAEVAETAAIAEAMVDQAVQTVADVAAATLEPAVEAPSEPSAKLRAKARPADEPSPDA